MTISNTTKSHVYMDWSFSRPLQGDDDPLYRPDSTVQGASQISQALLSELAPLKLAEPWATILAPQSVSCHTVFHWTSRCVYVPSGDIEKAVKQGIVFAGDSWHAMPIFGT